MEISRIGFGTYRVGDNKAHLKALTKAIESGITTIDTSSNYTSGDAEKCIAKALKTHKREKLTIISKGGYLQGDNLKRYHDNPLQQEVVFYQEGCFHCIAPDFLEKQLTESLKRLETNYIDTYLIHNPEYYLLHNVKTTEDKDKYQKEMLERIYRAFVMLEKEVKKGRIKSYGISSNSFAKKSDALDFLPYESLMDLAKKAASGDKHHFTTIQLPFNMLEIEGLACIKWAKTQGIEVITNRPLNAFYHQSMYRLATYPADEGYEKSKEALLKTADTYQLPDITRIITDLDSFKTRFSFPDNAYSTLHHQAFPQLKHFIESKKSEELVEIFNKLLPDFFNHYLAFVRAETSAQARYALEEAGYENIQSPLQKMALDFILSHKEIDLVLVGAKSDAYVEELIQL